METGEEIDPTQKLQAQIGLGQALKFVGQYDQARQSLKEALRNLLNRPEMALSTEYAFSLLSDLLAQGLNL